MKNINKPSQPKRHAIITIVIAAIGFIAANFTDRFLLLFISFNEIHTNTLLFSGVLQILGNILLASLIAQYLYKSAVDIKKNGPHKRNIVQTGIGVLIFVTMLGGQIMSAIAFQEANDYFITSRAESAAHLKAALNSNLTPAKLAKLSFLYAQQNFEYDGTTITYTTEDGKSRMYEPTDESRKNRSFIIMSGLFYRLEPKVRTIATVAWSLFALGTILAIFLGPNKDA